MSFRPLAAVRADSLKSIALVYTLKNGKTYQNCIFDESIASIEIDIEQTQEEDIIVEQDKPKYTPIVITGYRYTIIIKYKDKIII